MPAGPSAWTGLDALDSVSSLLGRIEQEPLFARDHGDERSIGIYSGSFWGFTLELLAI